MEFTVIDKITGKEADVERIALTEEWAKGLIYCDMEGFAVTEYGDLILLDECGRYVDVSQERFEVKFAERTCTPVRLKAYTTDGKGEKRFHHYNYYCSQCGKPLSLKGNPSYCRHCGAKIKDKR